VNNIIFKQIQDDLNSELNRMEVEFEVRKDEGIQSIKTEFEEILKTVTKKDNFLNVTKDIGDTLKKKFAPKLSRSLTK
jgi:hypothetical protein